MATIGIPSRIISEPKPSTRQSLSLPNKTIPIDATLSAAGTAEDLFLLAPDNVTVNLVTNPSFETADPPTGYTAVGSTIARDGTQYNYGSYSASVTPDNAATGEGFYWTLPAIPRNKPLTCSVYLRRAAGSGSDARIRLYGVTTGAYLASGNTITLSASWQRSTVGISEMATSEVVRIYVETVTQHGTVFYADGLQAEMYNFVTDYCDGAQSRFTFWGNYPRKDGTAHASESYRVKSIWEPRKFHFFFQNDTYIEFDKDATSSSLLKLSGDTWWEDGISFDHKISFLNAVAGEQPRVIGAVWGVAEQGDGAS